MKDIWFWLVEFGIFLNIMIAIIDPLDENSATQAATKATIYTAMLVWGLFAYFT